MEFIVGWDNDFMHVRRNEIYIRGSFLYIPIQLNEKCASRNHRHFRAIYLDKDITNENWTQYIRSYEKLVSGKSCTIYHCNEVPAYANRWTELFGFGSFHFYHSDPSLKSKIDHIRNAAHPNTNAVCIAPIYFNFRTVFCLDQCSSVLPII